MVSSPARIAVQLNNLRPNNDCGDEDVDNDGGDDEDMTMMILVMIMAVVISVTTIAYLNLANSKLPRFALFLVIYCKVLCCFVAFPVVTRL